MDDFHGLLIEKYKRYIQLIGMLSRLFSENDAPYIDSRFVENLYCYCHKEGVIENLARLDNSFDAQKAEIGVGIKTFLSGGKKGFKDEKVAEFTKLAQTDKLASMSSNDLAFHVAGLRNKRIIADANANGIDISKSFYHCLIRERNSVYIHEEPYPLIAIENIHPTDSKGQKQDWFLTGNVVCFTDGQNLYRYNRSKNVLLKRFSNDAGKNSDYIPIVIAENPFLILDRISEFQDMRRSSTDDREYVILPLTDSSGEKVAERSGINAWNAGGRPRTFGEAYISVPRSIHRIRPDFFPMTTDNKGRKTGAYFPLHLPDGQIITASLCQENMKALMAQHNADLVTWLYKVIDGSMEEAEKRKTNHPRPYTYDDLLAIGKDSVAILKTEVRFVFPNIFSAPLVDCIR